MQLTHQEFGADPPKTSRGMGASLPCANAMQVHFTEPSGVKPPIFATALAIGCDAIPHFAICCKGWLLLCAGQGEPTLPHVVVQEKISAAAQQQAKHVCIMILCS